jgi:dienelactone hydrolase
MGDSLADFDLEPFTTAGKTKDVYRLGAGPAVIVIAEIPGITPRVADFARKVAVRGMTAVMPVLFGEPGKPPTTAYIASTLGRLCVSREFNKLALRQTTPVTSWLRALAAAEHERCGGPGVGVVGMCFTGGFALGMMVDDVVVAPVLSQPSVPFPVTKKHRGDVGISDSDLARVKERVAAGTCVLGLRFSADRSSPPDRFETLRRELGDGFISVELDSSPGNPHGHPRLAHSVLTEHLDDREGTPTRAALDQVLTFFADRLGVAG